MSLICSQEAAPGFKVTALSRERPAVIECYCLTNQYLLWVNLAGKFMEKRSGEGAGGLGEILKAHRDGERSGVYELQGGHFLRR